MIKNLPYLPTEVLKLGSNDVEHQIHQAVANARLEGLQPSDHSIGLIRSVVSNKLSGKAALNSLLSYYGSHT